MSRIFGYIIRLAMLSILCAPGLILVNPAYGQFLNIQIDLQPDASTTVVRSLDFGSIPSDAGIVSIPLGDPGMGVFSIRAVQTQRMLLSVDVPGELQHETGDAVIPINLELAYTDFGVDDFRQANPVSDPTHEIEIQTPPDNPDSSWSFAHLYVFGDLTVTAVPEGIYTGDVILYIEYE